MSQSPRIAVQMDPPESADPAGDTSLALIEEAGARGFPVWTYHPRDLALIGGRVVAPARRTRVERDPARVVLADSEQLDLGRDADIVLMRQDPPVDELYLTATHLLELIGGETLVANDPKGVRDSPEKMLPLRFPELMPPTLIARDPEAIGRFRQEHGDIVLKPLHGHGGRGVFRVRPGDGNFAPLVETLRSGSPAPLIAQAFLPAVSSGDKRILLVDGEPCGAINRVPAEGGIRSNMVVGGRPEATSLTDRDREICAALGPELRRRGLMFAGIDVIGEWLTEINVTSPTGARAVQKLGSGDPAARLWDALLARSMMPDA